MTTLQILKELIKNEAMVELNESNGKYYCKLKESVSDYELQIDNLPRETIVISADKFPSPNGFFANSKMECKRADYIIVTEIPKKQIVYIELKRSTSAASAKHVTAQLIGAKCVMEYCKAVGKEFWRDKDFLNDYECRYVRFVAKTLDKKGTRPSKAKRNDTPQNALIVKSRDKIQFGVLT
jgi:hypothetical protein